MPERVTIAVLCRPVRLLRNMVIAGTLLSTIAMIVTASAQSDYPNRAVQLIVPYGAGGIADVGMRILADQLTNRLKQQFVVENRPGAGGIVAASRIRKSSLWLPPAENERRIYRRFRPSRKAVSKALKS